MPWSSCIKYILSWVVAAKLAHSALHVERAIVGCFLDFQAMTGPFSTNIYNNLSCYAYLPVTMPSLHHYTLSV